MGRTISIGAQGFADLRSYDCFYVDKTAFLSRWWYKRDQVTLICRPRRFGKTLTLDMVRCFFSPEFAGRGEELFLGLEVWDDAGMRALQGTVPVIFVSFADVKGTSWAQTTAAMRQILRVAVRTHSYLEDSPAVDRDDRAFLSRVSDDMDDITATTCLKRLCAMLEKHWGIKPVVLLDEYDTPLQEAWLGGYWDDMAAFVRLLFNSTFKTNPSLGRALITGITRVSQESIFSDMNNPEVVTTLSRRYEDCFGFTEREVLDAMAEYAKDDVAGVRSWYDGFTFGDVRGIYNPWSITKYLDDGRLLPWWVNTSSNGLVSELVRTGGNALKRDFEKLLAGGSVMRTVDEWVSFRNLFASDEAIWALLLAAGYLRLDEQDVTDDGQIRGCLSLTNREVAVGFRRMVSEWFAPASQSSNAFVEALLTGDAKEATSYLNDVTRACMSSFDVGTHPNERAQPERFYHGLVLGLLVGLRDTYAVESNRESGYGRYDIALVPKDGTKGSRPAVIIEFKVFDPDKEHTLSDTVRRARNQIEEKGYAAGLVERGFGEERILSYGIGFRGKHALVG